MDFHYCNVYGILTRTRVLTFRPSFSPGVKTQLRMASTVGASKNEWLESLTTTDSLRHSDQQ